MYYVFKIVKITIMDGSTLEVPKLMGTYPTPQEALGVSRNIDNSFVLCSVTA